jgi:hypothetical protein
MGVQLWRQTDKFRFTLVYRNEFNVVHHLLLSVSDLVKIAFLLADDKGWRHLLFILNIQLLHETAHILVHLVDVLEELIPADDLPSSFVGFDRKR